MSVREPVLYEPDPPRRLTPTEQREVLAARLHEITMAFAQRAASPPEHSVSISRNAKGVAQFEVTVRGFDLDAVATDAMGAFGVLEAAWPYPSENGGAE